MYIDKNNVKFKLTPLSLFSKKKGMLIKNRCNQYFDIAANPEVIELISLKYCTNLWDINHRYCYIMCDLDLCALFGYDNSEKKRNVIIKVTLFQ